MKGIASDQSERIARSSPQKITIKSRYLPLFRFLFKASLPAFNAAMFYTLLRWCYRLAVLYTYGGVCRYALAEFRILLQDDIIRLFDDY